MRYTFGTYELDTQACELRRAGHPLALAPKVYHVLAYLVQHHDRLITKDELLEQVWPQTYVDDSAVKRCIMAARRAIGDHSGAPQHIKTARGRGYRFIAPVTVHPPGLAFPTAAPAPPTQQTVPEVHDAPPLGPARHGPETAAPAALRSCPACQAPQSLSARFCSLCGTPLVLSCTQCHADVFFPATFCSSCGQPVADTAAPAGGSAQAETHPALSEQKLVSVLSCVVHNITDMINTQGLDAVHRLMQSLYTLAQAEAQRYEGTLQVISGEGFLVFFGVPVAQEDHAQRATLMAQAVQQQVRTLPAAGRSGLDGGAPISLALHTGYVAFGQHETSLHTIIVGDTATLAVTIARQAAPGRLVASAATIPLMPPQVRTRPAGSLQVAAQMPPLNVYEILLDNAPSGLSPAPAARRRSPFVGRAAELAVLQARLGLVERGRGQVVSITGEPGMGKSRLLYELHHTLRDRQVRYLQGSCQSYGHANPYLPLRDLLQTLWGLHEGANPATITRQVHAGLATLGAEADAWAPYLLHLLGGRSDAAEPALPAETLRTQTIAALHWLFASLSQQQPCVLVLENLHWVDATSAAYLEALVERLAPLPMLLLVTYRPGAGYRPPWLDKSYASQVALAPLDPEESRQLLRAVLRRPRLTPAVETQMLHRAEGNPLFLEELVSTMAAPQPRHQRGSLPDTIQALLAARIDRLPTPAKRLLQAAAVIGMEASLPLLVAVLNQSPEVLRSSLDRLQATEFLYETRSVPETVYTFKHILTQEVAYESLLPSDRQVVHGQIVEALEAQWATPSADQLNRLAHHAWHAARWDKAATSFRLTGILAAGRSSYREAVLCFEQALACLQHLPADPQHTMDAIDLRFELRNVLLPLGEHARILQLLQEAEPLAEALEDAPRRGWMACYLSAEYFTMGMYAQALHTGQRALSVSLTSQDLAMQVISQLRLGQLYHVLGDYTQAMTMLRHNLTRLTGALRAERFGLAGLAAVHSLAWLAWCCAEVGAFAEGVASGTEAVEIASAAERPYDLLTAYCGLGLVHLRQGHSAEAIAVLERGMALCQRLAMPLLLPVIATFLGEAYALTGRTAEAMPLLEPIMEQARTDQPPALAGHCGIRLGYAYLLVGRLEEAGQIARWALELCQTRQERGHEAYAWWLLGEITAQHEPAQATTIVAHYHQALTLASTQGMQPLRAGCLLGLGTYYSTQGQEQPAQAALAEALSVFTRLDMPFWRRRAEVALGHHTSVV